MVVEWEEACGNFLGQLEYPRSLYSFGYCTLVKIPANARLRFVHVTVYEPCTKWKTVNNSWSWVSGLHDEIFRGSVHTPAIYFQVR